MSDDLSPRERRRQQAKSSGKVRPSFNPQKLIVPGVILVVLAFITVMAVTHDDRVAGADCPGHWHSTMKVYVDGQEVDFSNYNLENGRTPMSSHFHQGDTQWQWHFEPGQQRCIPFEDATRYIDMSLSRGTLELTGDHEARPYGGVHENEGERTLQIHHKVDGEEWDTISAAQLNDRQLKNGERLLILFGEYSEEEIEQLRASVPAPTGFSDQHPGA